MFELVTLVFLLCVFLARYWRVTLFFLAIIIPFFFLEFNMHSYIEQTIANEKSSITKQSFLFKGAFILFLAIYFIRNAFDKLPPEIYVKGDLSFSTIYSITSIYSILIFLLFYSLKAACISLNLVSVYDLKRGLFGFLYKWIILIRTIFVTYYWLKYFSKMRDVSIIYEISHSSFDLLHFYISLKALYISFLLWDLDNTRRVIRNVLSKMYKLTPIYQNCPICHQSHKQMALLKCDHAICESCARKSLEMSPFCPICNASPYEGPTFSYLDGTISFSSLFCCL